MPRRRSGCAVGKLDVPVWMHPASAGASRRSGPTVRLDPTRLESQGAGEAHSGSSLRGKHFSFTLLHVLKSDSIDLMK